MHFGTYMGIFWIAKFAFLPLGLTSPFLLFIFVGLTIMVPVMGYRFTKLFRDKICGETITFMQAFVFQVFMYMFASLLTAAGHYIYFRFIDKGYIVQVCRDFIANVPAEQLSMNPYLELFKSNLDFMETQTAIELTMQHFTTNVLYCSLIALVTALFVIRKKPLLPQT